MAKDIDLLNPAAVLGRRGGIARAKSLSKERIAEIALNASKAAQKAFRKKKRLAQQAAA